MVRLRYACRTVVVQSRYARGTLARGALPVRFQFGAVR